MKRISLAVAVASLLVAPAVLAQPEPPPVSPPAQTHQDVPTSPRLLRATSFLPLGSFEDTSSTDPGPVAASPVKGSFEDATSTDPQPAPPSPVTTSFEAVPAGD